MDTLHHDEKLRLECLRLVGGNPFNARHAYQFIKESASDARIVAAARAFAKEVGSKEA